MEIKSYNLLVDGDVLLYRCLFRLQSGGAVVDHCVDVYEEMQVELHDWKRRFCSAVDADWDHTCCTLVVSPSDTFRHNIHPGYKSTRRKHPRPHWYEYAREAIHNLEDCDVAIQTQLEADDVIGVLATRPGQSAQPVIVTIDKDLDQIPGMHFNPVKDGGYYVHPHEAERFMRYQWLTGDAGDDIPGLPRVGPKRAETVLEPFTYPSTGLFDRDRADLAIRKLYAERGFSTEYCETQRALVEILQYPQITRLNTGWMCRTAACTLLPESIYIK